MAAVAATGASFAQATITGTLAAGYGTLTSGGATATTAGGFGVDFAELYITAKEDLGGGMTAGGTYGIGGLERAGWANSNDGTASGVRKAQTYPVYGTNFNVYVQNAMFKLAVGNARAGDYVSSGLASSGVNWWDFGDYTGNFGARSRRDYIALDIPVGPLTIGLAHQEAGNAVGEFDGAEGSTGQRLAVLNVTYAEGPVKINAAYLGFDNVAVKDGSTESQYRLSGNFNAGVATVGAGMQMTNMKGSWTSTNYGFSAAVPVGPLTLGAMIGQVSRSGGTEAFNGTLASYSLNASYAMSKRTSVVAQYSNWEVPSVIGTTIQTTTTKAAATRSSMAEILLVHNF